MTDEELSNSIQLLRDRRKHLGDLRDYKPQRSGKKTPKASEPERDVADVFSDLIKPAEDE